MLVIEPTLPFKLLIPLIIMPPKVPPIITVIGMSALYHLHLSSSGVSIITSSLPDIAGEAGSKTSPFRMALSSALYIPPKSRLSMMKTGMTAKRRTA